MRTDQVYLRPRELACHLRVSTRTVWRMVRAGALPRPLKPGPRVALFRVQEVREYLERGRPAP
jgi:excisionase family DNA binding protein